MSSIDKRIEAAVERALNSRQDREEFRRVKAFVADARERGLVVQKEYDLPLVDTIGRAVYQESPVK